MPITGLVTFEDNEILTAGKLNSIVQALESKFSALTADDFTWPMVVQGDIDFDSRHSIVSLRTFWNYVNADEYDSLQLAIDAAVGGGCVVIPPNTTITEDSVNIGQSSIWIVGCGPSSVLKLTSGASGGYHIRTGTGTLTDIGIMNLTMNGQSVASQKGFQFRFVDGCTVKGVTFKNYAAAALEFTHGGTPGTQKCQNVVMEDVRFEDGTGTHLSGIDIDKGQFHNIVSIDAVTTAAIDFEPASSAAFLKDLSFSEVHVSGTTGIGWRVLGESGSPTTNFSRIRISNSSITGCTGVPLIVGTTAKILRTVLISDILAPNAAGGVDALNINIDQGAVTDCYLYNPGGDGIDMLDSQDVEVRGCNCASAGAIGIVATGTTDCQIRDNNVVEFGGTDGIDTNGSTGLEMGGNLGHLGKIIGGLVFKEILATNGASGSPPTATVWTYTLPADTLSKHGDGLRINVTGFRAGAGGQSIMTVAVGGLTIARADTTIPSSTSNIIATLFLNSVGASGGSNVDAWSTSTIGESGTSPLVDNQSDSALSLDFTTDLDIVITAQHDVASSFTVRFASVEVLEGIGV